MLLNNVFNIIYLWTDKNDVYMQTMIEREKKKNSCWNAYC